MDDHIGAKHLLDVKIAKEKIDHITIKIVCLAIEEMGFSIVEMNELSPHDIEYVETEIYAITYSSDYELSDYINYVDSTLKELIAYIEGCKYSDDICNSVIEEINKTLKKINTILIERDTLANG